MRTILTAAAVTALVFAPGTGAFAQHDRQATPAQQNFKSNVKGRARTPKREHILRGESRKGERGSTVGAGPMER